jgi:3-oxoacyl-[acyl-carrier protein] reductase
MNITFPDKTVIVTGAAHGFGRAIALAFATRGARVWACDVMADELNETRRLCVDAGGWCQGRVVDVSEREAVFAFVGEAEKASVNGQVDVLVNDAGGVLGQVGQPLEQVTPKQWQAIFDVNVTGAFWFSRHEGRALWSHHQHLQRCGPGSQPDGHPGLRVGQGCADRPNPAART